jgi:GNAT superfamily N-acetyltransferase
LNFSIRPLRLPDDYEAIAELINCCVTEPTTAEELMLQDAKMYKTGKPFWNENGRLIGYDRERIAAVDANGRLIGFASCWRAPWTSPGTLSSTFIVDSRCRGFGIGSKLLEQMEHYAARLRADKLQTTVNDDDPYSCSFAERHGFVNERQLFKNRLDLSSFCDKEGSAFLASLESIENSEAALERIRCIRFLTLQDEPGEHSEKKLYGLCKHTEADVPGAARAFPDFTEWQQWSLYQNGFRPELVLIAADGDRFVGIAQLLQNGQTGGFHHEFTGVERAYRRRGIATALKLRSIRLALNVKASYLSTDNDSHNAPMLAINRRLGFQPVPGHYRYAKQLR